MPLRQLQQQTATSLSIHSAKFSDIDDYAESLRGWSLDLCQLSPGNNHLESHGVIGEGFNFLRFFRTKGGEARGQATAPGLSFFITERVADHILLQGKQAPIDTLLCIPQYADIVTVTPDQYTGYAVTIPQAVLDRAARDAASGDLANGNHSFTLPRSATLYPLPEFHADFLRQSARLLYHYTCPQADNSLHPHRALLAQDLIDNSIVPMLITILRRDYSPREQVRPVTDIKHLDTALRLITDNLESPPSVGEIASELNLTPRRIQYIFKQHLGITPLRYAKVQRLNTLRRRLRDQGVKRGAIKDLAQQLGFWHMGQLSRDYRAQFGHSPKETPTVHARTDPIV